MRLYKIQCKIRITLPIKLLPPTRMLLTLLISLLTLTISLLPSIRMLMTLPLSLKPSILILLTSHHYGQEAMEVLLNLLRKILVLPLHFISFSRSYLRNHRSCWLIQSHRNRNISNRLRGHYWKFRQESTFLELKKKFNDYHSWSNHNQFI